MTSPLQRGPGLGPAYARVLVLLGGLLTLALPLLAASGAAVADDTTSSPPSSSAVTVGIRTAGQDGPDDRGRYDEEIAPRGVRQDYVALYNYSLRPVTVRLLARDATSSAGSSFEVQPSADEPTGVGSWIAIQRPVVRMQPQSQTLVPFQIGVPYNASPGDHAGAIVASLLVHPDAHDGQVVADRRVGLRVYLRVPGALRPELTIKHLTSTFDGSWNSFGYGRTTVDYTLRNTGNVTLSADQVVQLASSRGLFPEQMRPDPAEQVLPGGEVVVHTVSPRMFAVGKLATTVTATPRSDQTGLVLRPTTARVVQWVVPWASLVTFGTATAALMLALRLFQRWHRRRPPKIKDPAHRRKGPPGRPERDLVGAESGPARSLDSEGDRP